MQILQTCLYVVYMQRNCHIFVSRLRWCEHAWHSNRKIANKLCPYKTTLTATQLRTSAVSQCTLPCYLLAKVEGNWHDNPEIKPR